MFIIFCTVKLCIFFYVYDLFHILFFETNLRIHGMYVCICMYVCMYVCMRARVCVSLT
jgi:hypothetical protein